MDTQEATEIRHAIAAGRPETDEGPYYHDSWWESYKGGIKGLLGGLFIGAGAAGVIGMGVGAVLALAVGATFTPATFALMTAAFMAVGAYKGAHEFSEVGIVTGAVAAAHEKSEERMKEFESAKFAELKCELQAIKAAIPGADQLQVASNEPSCAEVDQKQANYPTTHCDDHCERPRRLLFWKVAGIGLAVGALFGALFGAAGMFGEFLQPVADALHIGTGQTILASAVVGGGLGASFGINRDLFREIFDVTDHWFKGVFIPTHQHAQAQERQAGKAVELVLVEPQQEAQNGTYFQDRITAEAAKRALFSMDHTNSVRH